MRILSTATLATLGVIGCSASAFAQAQQGSSASSTQSPTPQTQQQSATKPPAAITQDRLRQVLMQAGFQDVRVVDASYLVQARTKEGDAVLMLVNPPEQMRGASAASGGSGGPGSTGSTTSGSGSQTGQSGTK